MRPLCGLVAFDLDGTPLRGPTVCGLIARPLGRLPEMQRFEADLSRAGIHAARLAMARWYRGHARAALCAGHAEILLRKTLGPLQGFRRT